MSDTNSYGTCFISIPIVSRTSHNPILEQENLDPLKGPLTGKLELKQIKVVLS